MDRVETMGIPSPDECVGVVGLPVGLVGITAGAVALFFPGGTTVAFAVVVSSLLVGWVSFLCCVVWGELRREGPPARRPGPRGSDRRYSDTTAETTSISRG